MLCSRCKKHMAVVFTTRFDGEKRISEGYCLRCAKELGLAPVDEMLGQMGITEEELDGMENQLMEFSDGQDADFDMGGAATDNFMNKLRGMMGGLAAGLSGNTDGGTDQTDQPDGMDDQNANRLTAGDAANSAPGKNTTDPKKGKSKKKKEEKPERKFLSSFCEDLTAKAKAGQLDRIIGRDEEIYRVVQILSRRTKNNPCLIGEPGVGKTAIAEGIAQRIVAGNVPARLADKEVYLLDLAALVAGTQFRGQFESRIKGLVNEVKREGNIILFIDEIHNLVGTGDAEGSMNAANLLKPALSRGEVQVIGATTFTEYRKYIEKDSALERRFQPVKVGEPSLADTVKVLQGIKSYYEDYHRVTVPDMILTQAVQLSQRYITDRFLPDKAIDMLDEACSCAALSNKPLAEYDKASRACTDAQKALDEFNEENTDQPDWEKQAELKTKLLQAQQQVEALKSKALGQPVTYDHLARVVELWTGIPASKVKESELEKVAKLEDILATRIVGQDEAVQKVAAAVRRSRVQLSAVARPASFLFVGPTGVGKTELAKVLAKTLFDQADPLIRLDMSEYMEKYAVSRMVGSPPGYVGYDEAGQLTEKVRQRPYSVVLFDEIEKAHPDVLNILLQILDEGRITDSHGRTVDFSNTVIVMTSNAGSDKKDFVVGFDKSAADASREKTMRALKEFLRPEFISRVDEIVIFHPLTKQNFEQIAVILLDELTQVLRDKGITPTYTDAAIAHLAEVSYDMGYGARDLRKTIRRQVEDPLASLLVARYANPPTSLLVDYTGRADDKEARLTLTCDDPTPSADASPTQPA